MGYLSLKFSPAGINFFPADLEKIHLDSDQLAQLLQTRYGFCERRAKREAGSFIADFAERLRRAAA